MEGWDIMSLRNSRLKVTIMVGEGSVEDDDDEEEKRRAAYMRNIHTANETEICGSQSYKYLIRRFMSVQFNFNWFVHLNIGEIERLLI